MFGFCVTKYTDIILHMLYTCTHTHTHTHTYTHTHVYIASLRAAVANAMPSE